MAVVLICGDRNWTDRETIRSWLCKLQDWGYNTLINGGARGADITARRLAQEMGFKVITHVARWDLYGRAAGPLRNRQMLDEKPVLVIAFHSNLSESKGTKDTVTEARRRHIETIVVGGSIHEAVSL